MCSSSQVPRLMLALAVPQGELHVARAVALAKDAAMAEPPGAMLFPHTPQVLAHHPGP